MKIETAFTTLISTAQLFAHLEDENWVVIDCRHNLTLPEWGQQEYQHAHIPGAIFAHLDRDLSGPVLPEKGRHPLPEVNQIANRLGAWGIGNDTQVIVYDASGGAFASRLWWQLRFLGHKKVAVLNGGYTQWTKEEYPISTTIAEHPEQIFMPNPNWAMLVETPMIEKIHRDPKFLLVDARAPERFRGEKEPIDPVAGHIPHAVNRFHGFNLGPDGLFLPEEVLHSQFKSLLNNIPSDHMVVYCGSGVTSCHHILAMEVAGLPGARLYAGSWSEWIRDPNHPTNP
ncbi:MAG: sulfurtransferase [Anaerolineaceae bacterium]|nr:sulfurtransferase [Anaerolineaceae bacterium]